MSKPKKILKKTRRPQLSPTLRKRICRPHTSSTRKIAEKRKALTAIVEKRTATIAKMQKNLDVFKTALEKTKNQKESESTCTTETEPNI
jgi:hypothetical protein